MKQLAPLTILLLVTAGCLGIPEDQLAPGDRVLVEFQAFDPDSGELLAQGQRTFVVGGGDSALGDDFERGLVGAKKGENVTFVSRDDPSRDYGDEVVEVEREQPSYQRDQTHAVQDFQQLFQQAPEPGMQFQVLYGWPAEVVAVEDELVQWRLNPEDGRVEDLSQIGANLVLSVDEQEVHQRLDPIPGTEFVIPEAQQTPLGMSPGSYVTRTATDTHIQYAYHPSPYNRLLGHPVEFRVQVVDMLKGSDGTPFPDDGQYGVRRSPQVEGSLGSLGAEDGHDHAAHGH